MLHGRHDRKIDAVIPETTRLSLCDQNAIGKATANKFPRVVPANATTQSSLATLSKKEKRRLLASAYHWPGPLLAASVAAHSASVQSRRCIDRSKPLEKNSSDHSHQVPSFLTPRNRSYRSISAGAMSDVTEPNTSPVLTTRFNSRTARGTCFSATWHRLVSNTKSNSPSLNVISAMVPSLLNFFSAFGVWA